MVVALTGATGLLGSNILFELFRQYRDHPDQLTVWILGRPSKDHTLRERMKLLLTTDGCHYLGTSDLAPFLERIRTVDCYLDRPELGITPRDIQEIKSEAPDLFIHSAAAVDFRDQPGTIAHLNLINVEGTSQVINLAEKLGVKDFAFISTAYVSGIRSGVVAPDFVDLDQEFRNHYEKSKLQSEALVRLAHKEGRFERLHCFRPSTVCGRLIESPIGYTPKFDVFYAWLSFFLRLKAKQFGGINYDNQAFIDIRVALKPGSGLNIISADYAAKALVTICLSRPESGSYHLASPQLTDNYLDLPDLLRFIKVEVPPFVEEKPADLNPMEHLYYHKSVGKIYDPYISQTVPAFSLDELNKQLPEGFPECPAVKGGRLQQLLEFAKQHNFGL